MAETQLVTIRQFSDAKIQAAIDHALSVLPPDRSVAIVAHADLNGATLTAVGKIGNHWSLSGSVSKPWNGSLSAEAEVIASW
jgi:hypothetical protein